MTPTSGPPSFRVYAIDPGTFGVLDFTQYIANASDAHAAPEWIPSYSAKRDYGSRVSSAPRKSDELTPAFWHNVTVAMERDPAVFQDFWARRTRGFKVLRCTGDCVKDAICALRGAEARFSCAPKRTGFSLLGRGTEFEKRVQPECTHAGMAPLLAKIAHRARLARQG